MSFDLHENMMIVDTHQDSIQRLVDLGHDLGSDKSQGYWDIPKGRAGNLSLVFQACCVDYKYIVRGDARARLNQLISALKAFCQRHPDDLTLLETLAQLSSLGHGRRAAVLMSVEGAQAIGNDLGFLDELYSEGVRSVGLTHFTSNAWADASTDSRLHGGLSSVGREAIARLNKLKLMIDLSHCSDEAFWQTLDMSEAAPFASHSCSRHFVDIPRNMSDEMIVALAKRGGVIGMNFVPEYIHPPYIAALDQLADRLWPRASNDEGPDVPAGVKLMRSRAGDPLARYNAIMDIGLPAPDLQVVVEQIDHLVQLVGPEHICIGSDHGAVRFDVTGLEDCSKLHTLTQSLIGRGYTENDVRLIMGGSILNYMKTVLS